MRVYTGPPTWTTVPVDVTDADVSPELVPAVMRAMSAGIDRQRLLALLFKEANKNGRTFVLFWGVHGGDGFPDWKGARTGGTTTQTFRVPVRNSLPPPGKALAVRPFYSLRQTLHVSAHILDMTVIKNEAFLRVTLTETPLPATAPPPAGWTGLTVTQTLSFHDGETQLLSATTRADGAHHLVFVTAHIVPPFGAADREKGHHSAVREQPGRAARARTTSQLICGEAFRQVQGDAVRHKGACSGPARRPALQASRRVVDDVGPENAHRIQAIVLHMAGHEVRVRSPAAPRPPVHRLVPDNPVTLAQHILTRPVREVRRGPALLTATVAPAKLTVSTRAAEGT